MATATQLRVSALVLSIAMAILAAGSSVAHARAVLDDPGCTTHVLPRNDDEYTGPVPIGFDVFFGGQFHSTLRISNNGYVVFSQQTLLWWILRNWEQFRVPLIALYHHDVDTRPLGTTPVSYGPITFAGRPALCVNWVNVGYFDNRDDLLNSFQLILVDRSDTGAGDVDIYMNYDRIEWEQTPAAFFPRVGIYDGTAVVHEFPGSAVRSALIDGGSSALIGTSAGSAVLGRYVFQLRGGQSPNTAVIDGTVLDTNGNLVAGAPVQACDRCLGVNACVLGSTDSRGHYSLSGFDPADIEACSSWRLTISPPTDSLLPNTRDVTFTASDQIVTDVDVVLGAPEFIPSGASITPSQGGGFGSVPVVFWQAPLTLTMTGCTSVLGLPPPVARYMITRDDNRDINRCDPTRPRPPIPDPDPDPDMLACGPMIESGPGRTGIYVAQVPALAPAHGLVTVTMGLTCPDPDPDDGIPPESGTSSFDIYIDPSGWVQTVDGTPLSGALVTLYRSETPTGPFVIVPDGSPLMSPKNRTNPDRTDSEGHFGWDTVAGYYVVRAEYPGCISPIDPQQAYVETDVLPVPPEWTDLHLYLDCEGITPPTLRLPLQVLADAPSTAGAQVVYEASALDGRDGALPVTCSSSPGDLFSVGVTMVDCTATDSSGNTAHGSFAVRVSYASTGVLPPLRPDGPNPLRRGRTVQVKLQLTGASAAITNLDAHLYVAAMIGSVPGPELPARPADATHRGSKFHYNASEHEYQFNWSTIDLPVGHYRLRIDLGDGVQRTVPIEVTTEVEIGDP